MALTQIQAGSIEPGAINTTDLGANVTATYATYAAVAANLTPRITTVNVANSSYTVLDDTSVNTSGGYLVITGANFQSGAIVTVQDTNATSTTYVNDTTLRAQVPAKTAGSYNLYVTNPDGGTAIKVLGVSYSNTPVWGTAATLSNQAANTAFAVNISANSDSNVTYSNTTSLPAGTTLLANGLFYGTVTIGAETVYTFTVNAIDAELQDTPREFSLTVTVTPVNYLYSWGLNNYGELGQNNRTHRSSPTQVGTDTNWSIISKGLQSMLAIKTDGTLWTWGAGGSGQLGLNDRIYRSSPTQIGSSTNWSKISTASRDNFCFGIKTDGTLWTWGNNGDGQSGLNNINPAYRSSPTQVGTDTNWSIITSNFNSSFAIKTNGTLWAWGNAANGALGLNARVNKSSPTQIGADTNWNLIASGKYSCSAIKTDGTLWSWGYSAEGQLGNESSIHRSSPIQIGTNTNWSKIYNGTDVRFAIKTDGTLWTWGSNQYGNLGLNDKVYKSSPVQVGSATNWSLVSIGTYVNGPSTAAAIKTDGTLWTWGKNDYSQLGLNDNVYRSSPTQVGTNTNWNLVSISKDQFFATTK